MLQAEKDGNARQIQILLILRVNSSARMQSTLWYGINVFLVCRESATLLAQYGMHSPEESSRLGSLISRC